MGVCGYGSHKKGPSGHVAGVSRDAPLSGAPHHQGLRGRCACHAHGKAVFCPLFSRQSQWIRNVPTGWANNNYWSATSTGAGTHVNVNTNNGNVNNNNDTNNNYAALQVL
jgi:hypothetical protein